MKTIVLALMLSAASDEHSLGIGLDVVPQAFSVAAARVRFDADLRFPKCSAAGCRWDLGDGVGVSAALLDGSLSIDRLEADWNPERPASTSDSAVRYQKACLTIVALVQPDGSPADRRTTAQAIAIVRDRTPEVELDRPDIGVKFYGSRTVTEPPKVASDPAMRCGAVVDSLDDRHDP